MDIFNNSTNKKASARVFMRGSRCIQLKPDCIFNSKMFSYFRDSDCPFCAILRHYCLYDIILREASPRVCIFLRFSEVFRLSQVR